MSEKNDHPDVLKASRLGFVSGMITAMPLIGLASFFISKKVRLLLLTAEKEMKGPASDQYKPINPLMFKVLWHLPTAALVVNILSTAAFIGFYFWAQHTLSSSF